MDSQAHLRPAAMPFAAFVKTFEAAQQRQAPSPSPVSSGLHLTIPSQPLVGHRHRSYPTISSHTQSYPSSPTAASHQRHAPKFPKASVSYPVLPVAAHNSGKLREATLHTKNPLADTSKPHQARQRPKMHLFAGRTKADHAAEDLPEPPVEWVVGSVGTSSPPSDESSASSQIASEISSEDESDYNEISSGDSASPLPFEYAGLGENEWRSSVDCRVLSLGLKALLNVQA